MSDNREGPEYDWLYSPGARPDRRRPPPRPEPPERPTALAGPEPPTSDDEPHDEPHAGPDADAEATRAVPAAASSPEAADPTATQAAAAGGPSAVDPHGDGVEHTQMIEPAESAESPEPAPDAPDAAPAEPPKQSFGGVYAAPSASAPPPGASPPDAQPSSAQPSSAQPSSAQRYRDRPPASVGAPPAPPPSAPQPTKPTGPSGPTDGTSKHRNWWLRGAGILIAAWLIYLIVVPIWTWQHISKVDAEPSGERPGDTPGTTYLLVGSDSREGLTKEQRGELGTGQAAGQRTDTIILLHVPAGDGPRLLLSIPRDSYVDIPGHGMNKINAAYSIGGPKLLVETIEKKTDIRIDDYIEVGFTGFVEIVDAVGGITVCPETSIHDPKAGNLKMAKGCQEVDGQTALDYSRSRAFPLGDITRAEHQREVITQVGKEAASWQTVVFPWRYWKVNHAAAESLRIGDNVGPIDLTRFAWAMAHTGGSDSKRCVVPYTSLGTQTSVGSVVTWDEKAAKAMFELVREDDTASIKCSAQGQ